MSASSANKKAKKQQPVPLVVDDNKETALKEYLRINFADVDVDTGEGAHYRSLFFGKAKIENPLDAVLLLVDFQRASIGIPVYGDYKEVKEEVNFLEHNWEKIELCLRERIYNMQKQHESINAAWKLFLERLQVSEKRSPTLALINKIKNTDKFLLRTHAYHLCRKANTAHTLYAIYNKAAKGIIPVDTARNPSGYLYGLPTSWKELLFPDAGAKSCYWDKAAQYKSEVTFRNTVLNALIASCVVSDIKFKRRAFNDFVHSKLFTSSFSQENRDVLLVLDAVHTFATTANIVDKVKQLSTNKALDTQIALALGLYPVHPIARAYLSKNAAQVKTLLKERQPGEQFTFVTDWDKVCEEMLDTDKKWDSATEKVYNDRNVEFINGDGKNMESLIRVVNFVVSSNKISLVAESIRLYKQTVYDDVKDNEQLHKLQSAARLELTLDTLGEFKLTKAFHGHLDSLRAMVEAKEDKYLEVFKATPHVISLLDYPKQLLGKKQAIAFLGSTLTFTKHEVTSYPSSKLYLPLRQLEKFCAETSSVNAARLQTLTESILLSWDPHSWLLTVPEIFLLVRLAIMYLSLGTEQLATVQTLGSFLRHREIASTVFDPYWDEFEKKYDTTKDFLAAMEEPLAQLCVRINEKLKREMDGFKKESAVVFRLGANAKEKKKEEKKAVVAPLVVKPIIPTKPAWLEAAEIHIHNIAHALDELKSIEARGIVSLDESYTYATFEDDFQRLNNYANNWGPVAAYLNQTLDRLPFSNLGNKQDQYGLLVRLQELRVYCFTLNIIVDVNTAKKGQWFPTDKIALAEFIDQYNQYTPSALFEMCPRLGIAFASVTINSSTAECEKHMEQAIVVFFYHAKENLPKGAGSSPLRQEPVTPVLQADVIEFEPASDDSTQTQTQETIQEQKQKQKQEFSSFVDVDNDEDDEDDDSLLVSALVEPPDEAKVTLGEHTAVEQLTSALGDEIKWMDWKVRDADERKEMKTSAYFFNIEATDPLFDHLYERSEGEAEPETIFRTTRAKAYFLRQCSTENDADLICITLANLAVHCAYARVCRTYLRIRDAAKEDMTQLEVAQACLQQLEDPGVSYPLEGYNDRLNPLADESEFNDEELTAFVRTFILCAINECVAKLGEGAENRKGLIVLASSEANLYEPAECLYHVREETSSPRIVKHPHAYGIQFDLGPTPVYGTSADLQDALLANIEDDEETISESGKSSVYSSGAESPLSGAHEETTHEELVGKLPIGVELQENKVESGADNMVVNRLFDKIAKEENEPLPVPRTRPRTDPTRTKTQTNERQKDMNVRLKKLQEKQVEANKKPVIPFAAPVVVVEEESTTEDEDESTAPAPDHESRPIPDAKPDAKPAANPDIKESTASSAVELNETKVKTDARPPVERKENKVKPGARRPISADDNSAVASKFALKNIYTYARRPNAVTVSSSVVASNKAVTNLLEKLENTEATEKEIEAKRIEEEQEKKKKKTEERKRRKKVQEAKEEEERKRKEKEEKEEESTTEDEDESTEPAAKPDIEELNKLERFYERPPRSEPAPSPPQPDPKPAAVSSTVKGRTGILSTMKTGIMYVAKKGTAFLTGDKKPASPSVHIRAPMAEAEYKVDIAKGEEDAKGIIWRDPSQPLHIPVTSVPPPFSPDDNNDLLESKVLELIRLLIPEGTTMTQVIANYVEMGEEKKMMLNTVGLTHDFLYLYSSRPDELAFSVIVVTLLFNRYHVATVEVMNTLKTLFKKRDGG